MEQPEQPDQVEQQQLDPTPLEPTQQQFEPQTVQDVPVVEQVLDQYEVVLVNPFRQEYLLTKQKFNSKIEGFSQFSDKIESMMKYREDRTYHLQLNDRADYISSMWTFLQHSLQLQSPLIEDSLMGLISNRQNNVLEDILESRLQIEQHRVKVYDYEEEQKHKKMSMLRDQSTEIQRKLMDMHDGLNEINKSTQHQTSESRFKAFEINQQKLKQYDDFLKKQKKEKEERSRLVEQFKKKEEEAKLKKDEEIREAREKAVKERKDELLKKTKQGEQKREKERQQREQRDKEYKFISKSLAEQPPLFKKLQQNYRYRYDKLENEKRDRVISERKSMFVNIDEKALQQHQKRYEQMRTQREQQRRERMEEYSKMMQLQEEEIQSKYKSNFQLSQYVNLKEEERKVAQEKKEKAKKYIEETVKERYLPRIDEQKRKQFLKLIEDMNRNKRVRKVRREDGSVQYQEIKPSDARQVGLGYLEMTKEMANKMKGRRKNSDQIPDMGNEKPKIFDYLADKRKKGTSMSNRDRLGFVNRKGLSFDEKCKKVELQSEKLQELAKQKEMKLKFGKFTTSDEILQHKEEIDQHYIDIINMKLKLINFKEE